MADKEMEGTLLDLSDRGLTKLEIPVGESPTALIADRNSITRIENLEQCPQLKQLSLKSNRLVHLNGVSRLRHLTALNLPQNSIIAIEGVRELAELTWLNLSGNSIKAMENLSNNFNLKHLDLSDNSISQLGDIHHLNNLKTLLLHGNIITTLKTAPHFLSKSVSILSLAENEIADINEVSYLSCLPELQQLSVMNNPCVLMTASVQGFDYRPFIVNWCPLLEILDGYTVTEKEQLKAEWLYSQGKGHHFKVGQHLETIQYLAAVCPLTASVQRAVNRRGKVKSLVSRLESAEDAKLSQILSKQRYHQQQLQTSQYQPGYQQQTSQHQQGYQQQTSQRSPQQQQQQHWNIPAKQSPPGGDNSNVSETGSPSQNTHNRPVRAWTVHAENSVSSVPSQSYDRSTGQHINDLSVQDVTSEDYEKRSTSSLLDSESTYIPVGKSPITPARPMTAPSNNMFSGPITQHVLDILSRGENRPATAIGDNKYDAYDKRPIKPMNPELFKGLFKPDFHASQPQMSGNEPVVGIKKKVPPTAQAVDCDTSQDTSQMDDLPKENVEHFSSKELSLIRDAAAKKARKTSSRSNREDSKSSKTMDRKKDRHDSVHSHSGNKTSIPVATKSTVSRTQSEYVPGKYSASRRPATAESDSRNKGKTIKTIPEKVIGSDRLNKSDNKRDHDNSLRDSGIYSRPTSDAVLAEDVRALHAATKIQSFWRGYYTREHNVDAVRVRREIRARRAEEHIVVLRTELDKQRQLYDQERQLRTLQLEAIRQLWREVQSLQSWKSEVLQSQSFVSPEIKREHDCNSYNSSLEIQNTLARAEMIHRMGDTMGTQSTVDTSKQRELEKTCLNLQSQVSQLQEALKSVSSIVLQSSGASMQGSVSGSLPVTPRSTQSMSSLSTTGNITREFDEEDILVTGDFDEFEISDYDSGSHWGAVPHSLSPYPSEEEETYFKSVPQPGFPTPPRGLRLENRGLSALVLRWQASKILDSEGKEVSKPLLGYRVFVNDKPKAMIAGTKQKALIEGLDPSLTYKIYVRAVSDLGESNSSDIVMAALSKGSRRRSSSSDSNRSYDSDRESTSSERRVPHRKDSRKSRKTKSPRSSKQERTISSHKPSENTTERPPSKMELEAEGIMTQPRMHKHRRTPSKDYQNREENLKPKETPQSPVLRSPKHQAQESQGFSFDSRSKSEQIADSQQSLSSTFTIDSQNSILALSTGGKSLDIDNSVDTKEDNVKGHRRRRSRDMKNEKSETRGDISDSGSSVSSAIILSRNIDSAGERNLSGTESPSVRRHRKKDTSVKDTSREDSDTGSLHRSDSTSKRNSAKISPTAGSQGVPVIDGRRRHGSGSRPSSPAQSDVSESRSSVNAGDRRRMPMADLLEQRFSGRVGQSTGSTASSTATLTQSQVDSSTSDLPPQIPRRDSKYSSLENLSTRSSHDYKSSPTERYSPTGSERRRTSSTCSESEIPSSSSAARQLDMDTKNSSTNPGNTGIVAKLLQKLQNFSKSQEESLQTTKYKRKSGETKDPPRKTSGDSDSSEVAAGQGTLQSDSSGAHSDDSQQVARPSYRTHRRTASDHRGVPVKMSEQTSSSSSSHRQDHSPVIMDSSKTSPAPSSSSNIKRHASFHGILPSKKEDLVRSGSTENLTVEKVSSTVTGKQQNIFWMYKTSGQLYHQDTDITVPTTPTRRHRNRSRSRSPGPASPHVPIISAAQLQRNARVPSTAT
ncbi:uncharacterized protein LOC123551935 isoform X2 [Mercenaria mercenaria]|uniref:uncharacterized protein LOC123551935 isoform X2 n=1 Tax=Mercenaria mercenaria TaxID=6596 RepID=UPI00234E8C91|nr:uncharacterized protein LOC123551935 isoform X2 [Mercenaria mercenaria]